MEGSNSSKKKLVVGMLAVMAVATAVGGAFVMGTASGGHGDARVALASQATAAATGRPQAEAGVAGAGQGAGDGAGQDSGEQDGDGSGGSGETPTAATATATPGDGCTFCAGDGEIVVAPTATATPSAGCTFCIDGDIAVAPTKVNPCPLCDHPVVAVNPADTTAPSIDDIHNVEFCGLVMYVDFTVSEESKVWLSYAYMGVTQNTPVEHVTDDAHLSVDLSDYGWGIYQIDTFRLHAEDYAGNVTNEGPFAMPEVDLAC